MLDLNTLVEIFKWPLAVIVLGIFFMLFFRNDISDFVREIGWLKTKWFEMKRIKEEIFAKAEEVQKLTEELNKGKRALQGITAVFVETIYLATEFRNYFPPPEDVTKHIEKNLSTLSSFAFENKVERDDWIRVVNVFIAKYRK